MVLVVEYFALEVLCLEKGRPSLSLPSRATHAFGAHTAVQVTIVSKSRSPCFLRQGSDTCSADRGCSSTGGLLKCTLMALQSSPSISTRKSLVTNANHVSLGSRRQTTKLLHKSYPVAWFARGLPKIRGLLRAARDT